MNTEALKLALEALEYASTGNRRPEIIGPAITAIREALAQPAQEPVARIAALEAALNEIASAGMSPSPEMSDDGKTAWHASQAWRFIGIAARAIELALAPVGERCCYHDSDCAVHNMPSYPAGPCDCSLASLAQPAQEPNNFCPRCGKRLEGVLGRLQVHTCTPPLWGHT
jgi:hypothetical protein